MEGTAQELLSLLLAHCLRERFNSYLHPKIMVQINIFSIVEALEGVSLHTISVTLFLFCRVSQLLALKTLTP